MTIPIVNAGYGSTNYYAIGYKPGQYLLIDCGWPGTLGKLKHQCKIKGIDLNQIKYFLVTHFHPDHAGLTQELINIGIRLLLLETQVKSAEQMKNIMKKDSGYVDIEVSGMNAIALNDSRAKLKSIGIDGEIISTPGHSPDSVTLILDEGVAFTGDLTPEIALPEDELVSRDSWKKIFAKKVTKIYPAHGMIK
jgi:ribonuclease/clavin/mitogillin